MMSKRKNCYDENSLDSNIANFLKTLSKRQKMRIYQIFNTQVFIRNDALVKQIVKYADLTDKNTLRLVNKQFSKVIPPLNVNREIKKRIKLGLDFIRLYCATKSPSYVTKSTGSNSIVYEIVNIFDKGYFIDFVGCFIKETSTKKIPMHIEQCKIEDYTIRTDCVWTSKQFEDYLKNDPINKIWVKLDASEKMKFKTYTEYKLLKYNIFSKKDIKIKPKKSRHSIK